MPGTSAHAAEFDTAAFELLGPELPLLCDDGVVAVVVLVLEASAVAPAVSPGEHFLMRPVSKQAPLWTPHSLLAGQVQTPSPR